MNSEPGSCMSVQPYGNCSEIQYNLKVELNHLNAWTWSNISQEIQLSALHSFSISTKHMDQCHLHIDSYPKTTFYETWHKVHQYSTDSKNDILKLYSPIYGISWMTWDEAELFCNVRGSHLISVHSIDMVKSLRHIYAASAGTKPKVKDIQGSTVVYVYIGLYQKVMLFVNIE